MKIIEFANRAVSVMHIVSIEVVAEAVTIELSSGTKLTEFPTTQEEMASLVKRIEEGTRP